MGYRIIGRFLLFGIGFIRFINPFNLILASQSVHSVKGLTSRSRRTDDYLAANFNEVFEPLKQSATRITLTFDPDFHSLDGNDDFDVSLKNDLFEICTRILTF